MTFRILTACVLASALAFSACDGDDDVMDVNEEEVITTVNLLVVGPSGPRGFFFRDLDGDGGQAPVIMGEVLQANTTYTYRISLTNEQSTPTEDITTEVRAEGDEHQFFFRSTGANLTFEYGDMDDDGRPIGITGTIRTGAASTGTMTLTLRHEPNKTAAGVAEGDIANAGGETDLEVTFPMTIQ